MVQYITKSCFGVVYNIGLGGGDRVCFVNVQKLCDIGWNGLKGFVQDCSLGIYVQTYTYVVESTPKVLILSPFFGDRLVSLSF